ncbi:MAG TPA: AAA family ATPase [Synergistaceae bacterium]|nr:AAA family ATPase [Synergistaceae bacterium]HPQ38105.1 AAA family ATPase [Synergistaceae bacterium]
MRICSILLENLNSLVGIWSVNFRSPSYGESGLFAITGPTGAGKSTLLDALCLGLYGRTPRLESISKKTNEVMSRQKGECRAEVVFEVPRGIFKASWGQHRADKNPRGKLQQPWRELANCGTGEILASSVEGVKTGVEELTGMDFHRFTRSVLLAQGGFASFLKASPSEKAPLLEQITGTDLYSRFSIYVHERHKREEELLREIESRSGGILLLSPEERKALETERLGVLEEETKLDFREKELRRGKEWREKLQALEEELREAEKDALLLEDRRKNAEEDLRRLRRGQQALALEAKYASLEHARKNREDVARKMAALEEERKGLEELRARIGKEEEQAKERVERARKNWEKQRPILEECCRREEELLALEKRKEEARQVLEKREKLREERLEEFRNLEKELRHSLEKLEEHAEFFEEHSVDASLSENFGVLREKWEQYRDKELQKKDLLREKNLSEELLGEKEEERQRLSLDLEERYRKKRDLEAAKEKEYTKLAELLEGKEVPCWRSREEECREKSLRVREMLENLKNLKLLEEEKARIAAEEEKGERRGQELSRDLEHAERLLEQIRKGYAKQEEVLHLSLRVASLEEERARLREGAPCPLCGSLEHPYQKEGVPVREKEKEELERLRQEQLREENNRRQLEKELTALESRLEHCRKERNKTEESLEKERQKENAFREESFFSEVPREIPALEDLQRQLCREEEDVKKRLRHVEICRKALEDLEKGEKAEDRELGELEKSAQSLTFAVEELGREIARREKDLRDWGEELKSLERHLRSLLAPYGISGENEVFEEELFEGLRHRRDAWKKRITEREEEKLHFRGLEERRDSLEKTKALLEEELEDLRKDLAERETLLQEKKEERRSLYEGDPRQGLKELEEDLEKTRKEYQALATRKMELQGKAEILENSRNREAVFLEEGEQRKALEEEEFQKALKKSAFFGEKDFQEARISAELREKLTLLQEELEQKDAALKERHLRGTAALEKEREKKITLLSAEELEKALEDCQEALREIRQKSGALEARLEEQKKLAAKAESLRQEAEARKKILREWQELHALVGSADGKKFRNFVQGLTFEMLVNQANRQLQKMTDRYLLLQDPDNPLEFSVLDGYQGGEIRSSKNLSGGESFLVSLALALGLSRMIGGKNRVESLFLDEGFGSLDEENLEVALQALGEVEGTCRLVGVISHVPALQERVANQIRVIPMTGGRSRLEGPGVARRG